MNRRIAVALQMFLLLLFYPSRYASSQEHTGSSTSHLAKTPIQALTVTPNNQIFVGILDLGVFMSTDNGETWIDDNTGLTDKDVLALVVDLNGTIFAGTFGGGVFRKDGIAFPWVQSNRGLDCAEVVSLEIAPDGSLYAGTSSHGIYCSRDNGERWTAAGLQGHYITTIAAASNDAILVGTNDGIYMSTNHGQNWRSANSGLTHLDVWAITEHPNGNLFAATNGGGVFRSQDRGATWVQLNNGLISRSTGSITVCRRAQLFVGTTDGVFCSTDNGMMWARVEGNSSDDAIRCLRMSPDGGVVAGTAKGNIYIGTEASPSTEAIGDLFVPENYPMRSEWDLKSKGINWTVDAFVCRSGGI